MLAVVNPLGNPSTRLVVQINETTSGPYDLKQLSCVVFDASAPENTSAIENAKRAEERMVDDTRVIVGESRGGRAVSCLFL